MIHGERDFALSISYHTWGLVIIAADTLLTLALYVRRSGVQALLLAAFTLTLGVFVLMTR